MKKAFLLAMALLSLSATAKADDDFGTWIDASVEKNITKGLDASAEVEFRTRDNMNEVERWSGSLGLDYRICSFLKASAGYTFLYNNVAEETTSKGNIIEQHWSPRHRASFSLTGTLKVSRVDISLRERYQMTFRPEQTVNKWKPSGAQGKDEIIEEKYKHVLRSRLQVAWNIRKSNFRPYISCELYNDFGEGFNTEKIRYSIGTQYRINKHHSVSAYYLYQDYDDAAETDNHVLGLSYKFKF